MFYFEPVSWHTDEVAARIGVPELSWNNRKSLRGMRCHYCGKNAESLDHIIPRSAGGRNAWWNLVPACRKCNGKKGSNPTRCACEYCKRAEFFMEYWLENGSLP